MLIWYLVLEDALEEEMKILSSILAWEIPRTEEPERLQSMELQRVRHDLATKHMHSQKLQTSSYKINKYCDVMYMW